VSSPTGAGKSGREKQRAGQHRRFRYRHHPGGKHYSGRCPHRPLWLAFEGIWL